MNAALKIPRPDELEAYINFLFEGLEGYMYVAAKQPVHQPNCTKAQCFCWDRVFLHYPEQTDRAVEAINSYSKTHEIYMAPALFRTQSATKEAFKETQVLWADFDGNKPESFDIPPSLVIQSSEPSHAHVYWKLDTPLNDVETVEELNRRLCYKYGSDLSGWDAVQVLRPPYTTNHKRNGLAVATILSQPELSCNLTVFDTLAPAPAKSVDYSLWEKIDLPTLEEVIYHTRLGPDFAHLFAKQKSEIHDRSASLTNMAFICAEAGMNDQEIYVIISHLADRWEKFANHTPASRARNLMGIIEHTRIKYPHSGYDETPTVFAFSPKGLYEAEINVDWAIEGLLIEKGNMLLAGVGGVGKTQFSMQAMFHCAAGKDFMHYVIPHPMRVGMMQLEMGAEESKLFMDVMYPQLTKDFTSEEMDLLNENCVILPFGENIPLNTPQGQDLLLAYQQEYQWKGVFIDSVGSSVLGNINSSETIQGLTNFNDKFRNRHNCFMWYIHHMRKAQQGNTNYGTADDVYGDVYLSNRATTVVTMTETKSGHIRMRNTKNRHAPKEEPFLILRGTGHTFTHAGTDVETKPAPVILEGKRSNLLSGIVTTDDDQSPTPFLE